MIRFDTKKDMDHYDNLYHQIYEKDKEIKRLNKRIEEIQKINLADHKYASEMEDKYITINNIINELEKYFDKELENLGYREEKLYTQGIHDTIIDHKYKLQELKGDRSNE